MRVELAVDVADVSLDRAHTDEQFGGDPAVGLAGCDELKHLQLALAQGFGQLSSQWRCARGDLLQRGEQLSEVVRRGVIRQLPMPPLVRFEHLGEEGGNLWTFLDEGPYVAFRFGQGEGLGQGAYGPLFLASFPQSHRLERKDLYLTAAPTRHLRRLTQLLEQPKRLVGLVLGEQHSRVRGTEVVGLRQDEASVEVIVNGPEGTRTERADFVVGCDGAHSTVRRLLNVGFVGATYETHIMLADVRISEELPTAVNAYVGRDGVVLLPAFGDGWYRGVIWDKRREHIPLDEPLGVGEVGESLRRIVGFDLGIKEMRWSTRFLSERRQAERYRTGRAFLAGDAAHVHSPLGALGMKTGIQDAMNLGWKLAAEILGWAQPWLLDSYHAERHPVGSQALRVTDLLQRLTLAPPVVRTVRPILARLVLGVRPVRRAMRRRISDLSIAYLPPRGQRLHPWTGRRVPDASFGESRLYELMHDGRFILLDRTPDGRVARAAKERWTDRVDIVRASTTSTRDWPAVLLVRPDGYAAWAGDTSEPGERLSAGLAALRHWCGSAITYAAVQRHHTV